MIGKVYKVQPQPPDPEHTTWLAAGALTIGVEYRQVDPAALVATYAANAEDMAEIEARSPEGGFYDEGVSLHVCGTDDGHEYLRFDVFADDPHYHYVHPGGDTNNVIEFDGAAHGDMLPWALNCLRVRLPQMLAEAGGGELVGQVDQQVLDPTIEQVAELAQRAASRATEASA
jgi:hypothetical protein